MDASDIVRTAPFCRHNNTRTYTHQLPSDSQSPVIQRSFTMKWPLYRENRVPHYQRLYQSNENIRLWNRAPRSKYMLYPYYVILWGGFAGSMYMMGRITLGHKTWFGKD